MALTERKILDQIEIKADGTIFVKELNEVLRDGVIISSIPHRTPISPLEDISGNEHKMVRDIASLIWTPQLKEEFGVSQAAARARRPLTD